MKLASESSPHLLEKLLDLLEETGPLRISIEDYLGILQDIPGLALSEKHYSHACDFCMSVKSNPTHFRKCFANKRAVNRILQTRRASFQGLCHLGVTDIVYPVLLGGVCVAGVFYGSVVVQGTEAIGRKKIREYCRRQRVDSAVFLERYSGLPRISAPELPVYRRRAELVVELLMRLIEESCVPLNRYRQEKDAQSARRRSQLPMVLQRALHHLDRNFSQPLTRASVAKLLHCNPNYLSGLFSSHLGIGMNTYLRQLRLDRAKVLLKNTDQTIGEIAFSVGFEDQSYFNRCFKTSLGITPMEFRARNLP